MQRSTQSNEDSMRFIPSVCTAFIIACASAPAALAQCGGSFSGFVQALTNEAVSRGHDPATVSQFFASARQDGSVIKADRQQGVF